MKNMRLLLAAGMVLFSFVGFCQDKTAEQKAGEITKNMKAQINFSDDKYDQINAVNLDFIDKAENLKAEEGSKIGKMKSLKEFDQERDSQLKEILSEGEFKLFKEYKSKNRKAFKEKIKESKK